MSWPWMSLACSCAMRTISSSLVLRTSKPQGQRRLFSSAIGQSLPPVPAAVHPHVHFGLAFEQLAEEVLDLGRGGELLQALGARPLLHAQERALVLRVERDVMRDGARLLRRGLHGNRQSCL